MHAASNSNRSHQASWIREVNLMLLLSHWLRAGSWEDFLGKAESHAEARTHFLARFVANHN